MKFVFAILILATVTIACNKSNNKSITSKSIHLDVMTVASQDVTVPQEYICEINAVQFVEVRARVQGYMEEILVDEGHWVKKGQPLFRLSSNEYKETVTRAEANVRRAIAEAKTKTLEADRISLMVKKNVISATELEVATAQKEAAESGVSEAKSVLENARINLSYTFIKAPFDGIIDRIPFKKGSLINAGSLLTSISNIDEVYAYFRVSEAEYLHYLKNDPKGIHNKAMYQLVSLVLADGSTYSEKGYVETVEGDFDKSTGSIAFRARFKNPQKTIKHGSTGKILIDRNWSNALLIPQQSAFTIQDKYFVFVLDKENKARSKNITTLERYKECFITNGLSPGDRVVIEGIQQLRDGVIVEPRALSADSVKFTTQLH